MTPSSSPLRQALRPCRGHLFAAAGFSGVVNVLHLTVSIYMMQVFDRVLGARNLDTLVYLTVIALFGLAVFAVLEAVRSIVMQEVGNWLEERFAADSFSRAIDNVLAGRPYRMEALRDLAGLRAFTGSHALLSIFDAPWVPVYLAFIFLLHPTLGFVALAGAVALAIVALANESATAQPTREAARAAMEGQRLAESIGRNAEVVDSMGMKPAAIALWREAADRALPHVRAAERRSVALLSLTKFLRLAVQVGILGAGVALVLAQQVTPGAAIAASIIMSRALAPVESLIGTWHMVVKARGAWDRVNEFLAAPPLRGGSLPLPRPDGRLVVQNLTYGPPGGNVALIKNVSFRIEPGELAAIIGPAAAGKTTLLRLLIGALPPSGGSVRLDGADVFHWQREDLGRHLGYLPQDVELLEGTVFRNIARLGPADPDDVYDAARVAGCHEMILGLPQGYETVIGEGGHRLSGGQRQMIGLARAAFGNPSLIILDEPNSNLDGESEQRLIAGLRELKTRGTTVIVVSHRITLVQAAEKILVMRDGAADLFGPTLPVLEQLRLRSAPPPSSAPPAVTAEAAA